MRAPLLLWLLSGCGGGGSDKPPPTSGTLDVLSYNVNGLPTESEDADPATRMAQISPLLADYDIVGLQEDWERDSHDLLAEDGEFRTDLWFGDPLDDAHDYGQGVALLSALGTTERWSGYFEACNGLEDAFYDCVYSKGYGGGRLEIAGGDTVDVYVSDLEKGNGDKDQEARVDNVAELIAAIQAESDGRALLLLADTNLDPEDEEDAALLAQIEEDLDVSEVCAELGCSDPGMTNRIFYRGSADVTLAAQSWREPIDFLDSSGYPLSDQSPVLVTVTWDRL